MHEFSASLSSNFRIAIAHERMSLACIFLALPGRSGLSQLARSRWWVEIASGYENKIGRLIITEPTMTQSLKEQ